MFDLIKKENIIILSDDKKTNKNVEFWNTLLSLDLKKYGYVMCLYKKTGNKFIKQKYKKGDDIIKKLNLGEITNIGIGKKK